MLENRNEIMIDAPVEKIWEILTELEKYAEWNPLLHQAYGKIEEGEKIFVHAKTATKDMKLNCLVTRVQLFRDFTWTFPVIHPILFRGEHIFRLQPYLDAVKFIDRECFKGLLLPTQAQDLKTNGLAAMITMGEALKARAEET